MNTKAQRQQETQRLYAAFPCIVVWGKHMGSFDYYIEVQCLKAERLGAPRDTLYLRSVPGEEEGTWVTLADLSPEHYLRPTLEEALKNG